MKHDWPAIAEAIDAANAQFGIAKTDDTEPDGLHEPTPVGEDILATTKVRRGQALFRSAVLSAYRNRCCITGLLDPRLLVASHIVPWRRPRQSPEPNQRPLPLSPPRPSL